VIAIAAGGTHTLALKSDGTVWAWGYNGYGQLGDGGTTNKYTPAQITSLTGIGAIAAGWAHSVVLKTDGTADGAVGTVWTFGMNSNGQLGEGSTVTSRLTVATSLSNVTGIGAGSTSTFALTADGTARSWGDNSYGQLGDNTTTGRSTPVTVIDLSKILQIDGGAYHAVAVTSDGSAWAWGDTAKIGYSQYCSCNTYTSLPQRVPTTGVTVLMASGGISHSTAALIDGTVWSWGLNGFGEWGVGNTSTPDYLPVVVPNFSLVDASWLTGDPDGDGLPTWKELQLGTDPVNADTNGDGVRDGVAANSGISPTSLDTDGDGVPNIVEIANGTDPLRADTDGDGVDDLHDCFPLDPSRSACGTFDPNDHTPPVITLQYPTNAVPLP
jgi:alpha-tubulin suppressor-like RCC1 family protein